MSNIVWADVRHCGRPTSDAASVSPTVHSLNHRTEKHIANESSVKRILSLPSLRLDVCRCRAGVPPECPAGLFSASAALAT